MDISRRKLELSFEGESFTIYYPSAIQSAEYGDRFTKETNDIESTNLAKEFLITLGMPAHIANVIEAEAMFRIITKFSEKKS